MIIEASTTIAAPVEKVFDLFTDLKKIEEYIKDIKKMETLEGPTKMEKGSKWKETRIVFGKEATETMTIAAIEKNKMYTTNAASHGAEYVATYTFKEENGKTHVSLEFIITPVSFKAKLFAPVGWLFKGATTKLLKKDMETLKEVLEKS